jgi:hypothetical protein
MIVIAVFLLGHGLLPNESGKTNLEQYLESGTQIIDEKRKLDSLESDYSAKKLECDLLVNEQFYGKGTCIQDLKAIDQKKSEVLRNIVQLREDAGLG